MVGRGWARCSCMQQTLTRQVSTTPKAEVETLSKVTVLYCTVLYCTVLHCTVLYAVM
jgi:hypothetical protein